MTTVTDLPLPRLAGQSADFARRGGQLRISFTPRCQLDCWFCHNEGEIPPRITHHDRAIQPRPRAMTAEGFLTAINAMTSAGIRRVFFTGTPHAHDLATLAAAVTAHLDAFTEGTLP